MLSVPRRPGQSGTWNWDYGQGCWEQSLWLSPELGSVPGLRGHPLQVPAS